MTPSKAYLTNKLETLEREHKTINEKLAAPQYMSSGQRRAYRVLRICKLKQIENTKNLIKNL